MPLRQADQHPACRAELRDDPVADVGQEDPGGIPTVAGIRGDQPALAGHLVSPGRGCRPRGEVAHGSVLDRGDVDTPREQVVGVDDRVETNARDRVHDRQVARSFVDQRLRVVTRSLGGEDGRIDVGDREALGSSRRCRSW